MKQSRNIALLLAGGYGKRMHADLPKQFMVIDGEMILLHTMKAFERHPLIHDIYVVCQPEWECVVKAQIEAGGWHKFRSFIQAGPSGLDSALNGIGFLSCHQEYQEAIVLIHDAVRPLISQDIISRNLAVCMTCGNAVTALPSQEAYLVSEDGSIASCVLPREGLQRAQTPITFPLATLTQIAQHAKDQGIIQSQSFITLIGTLGIAPLHLAKGEPNNFKLTTKSDLHLYRALKMLEEE